MDIILIPGLWLDGSSWEKVVPTLEPRVPRRGAPGVDEQGMAPVQEFTKIRDVEYVDLLTGHWPQFSRPVDLARAILASVARV